MWQWLAYIWLLAFCCTVFFCGEAYRTLVVPKFLLHNTISGVCGSLLNPHWGNILVLSFGVSMLQVVGFASHELSREIFGGYVLILVLFFTLWCASHRTIWYSHRNMCAHYETASYYSYKIWKWWVKLIKSHVTIQESSKPKTLTCENGNAVVVSISKISNIKKKTENEFNSQVAQGVL